MKLFSTILEIVFPTKCLSCNTRGEELCNECLEGFPSAERECARWIFPLFDYRHPPIKKAVHLLKYKGKKRIASIMAEILYEKTLEEIVDLKLMENFKEIILIPIPLSNKRLRERGYNQAELICKKLIEIDNIRNKGEKTFVLKNNILIKNKNTEHQTGIKNRKERLQNIIGSFSVKNGELIKNKNIILVDDVVTTGATLEEAKKILKQNGARKIIAFTIAH